jgi:cobalt-zinc-cadmium efflux system outer membrane protein
MLRRLLLLSSVFLASGCSWPVRETTDQTVREMVEHPYDIAPAPTKDAGRSSSDAQKTDSTSSNAPSDRAPAPGIKLPTYVETTAWIEPNKERGQPDRPLKDINLGTAAWWEPQAGPDRPGATPPEPRRQRTLDLNIPPRVPGSEAPRIVLPNERAALEREVERLYPELPPLPIEPKVQPGPGGKPYTLADLQRLAAENSPTLRQAISDVEAAKGAWIQARTYPNPTLSYLQDPTAVNLTPAVGGGALEQIITTGGKLKLGAAQAQKSLDNAVLALKRARSDLSTAVRRAYFAVLVDVETVAVTRALAQFSDEIYGLQTGLLRGAQSASYEPTALRAQTNLNRLAYKQAIASYLYDWKALVATLGMPQLPLTEIAGQVDKAIPYYDYDAIRAYVLANHTDVLTARNGVKIAQYGLKLAQVLPYVPNLDVFLSLEKDFTFNTFGTYQNITAAFPAPIWDQNKGNIIAAQGALVRASEESHRVEVTLTDNLALAYEAYRNNLYAMESYRRQVLPDLVRYYRGVFGRRQVDPSSAFGDLVFAQQNLSTNVAAYLTLLGSMWTSVVGVADFLQTDDLFQVAKPRELPELPDFQHLNVRDWVCGHDSVAAACLDGAPVSGPGTATTAPAAGGGPPAPHQVGPPASLRPAPLSGPAKDDRVKLVAATQSEPGPGAPAGLQRKFELQISPRVPGSEAPKIAMPPSMTPAERDRAIDRLYPELPPLPVEPKVLPGPGGKPYTLADFQRLAAAHSPTLRQAASDVEAARGNLIQAMTYTNPTVGYMNISSNNTNTAMATGGVVDQSISMGGKQKLGMAAAQKALDNANLALKRARSDLATAVRNAYFTVLVDVETLIITRALAQFSDDIYRLQTRLLRGSLSAPYEPTALRAQTNLNRLAYKQAIASYIYDWKALVATLGMPQLPLSEISGRVDRFIPYYDYDAVRAYVLQNHTDVLIAQNGVKIAQYGLKLAQVTPVFPDLDVAMWINKDFGNYPHGMYQDVRVAFPLPVFDQNKGNIIAAQAALIRAGEESHRVEVTLTNSLALAYEGYRNNLYAMEAYRRQVLPDLVRYYRGVFARRQVDPTSAFGDLVFAQQNLSTNVTAYIGILGALWTSVVSVADFLQTDDLFQLGKQHELPQLPDFTQLPHWACGHESAGLAESCVHPGTASAAPVLSQTGVEENHAGQDF